MAWPKETKDVTGHQRVSHQDGHDVNHSYKNPSATGKTNHSYMHPQVKGTGIDKAWQTADKTIQEAGRPIQQLGQSKSVFAVHQEKVPGAPPRPSNAKASRAPSHSPGIIQGPSSTPLS